MAGANTGAGYTWPQQLENPFVQYAMPFLSQYLGGGGANQETATQAGQPSFLQNLGHLFDEGMVEYARQMSMRDLQASEPSTSNRSAAPPSPAQTPAGWMSGLAQLLQKLHEKAEDGKFQVDIPLGDNVKPEDLRISIKDRELILDVKSESKSEDGTFRLYQELTRKVRIPEGVKVEDIKSTLAPGGILKIEAPLPQAGPSSSAPPQPVSIPVSMEVDDRKSERIYPTLES